MGAEVAVSVKSNAVTSLNNFNDTLIVKMQLKPGKWVILGHSERRQYFGEDGKLLAKKVDRALRCGLTPIFCCGEPLEIREKGTHETLVKQQVGESLFHLTDEDLKKVVVAYEPVWAIGTGQYDKADDAAQAIQHIRTHVEAMFGKKAAANLRVLYGGSVDGADAGGYLVAKGVDGLLIGGSSLKASVFGSIVQRAHDLQST